MFCTSTQKNWILAKIVSQTEIIKGTTLAPLLLVPKINDQNTVIGSPLSGNHEEKNEANSSGSRLDSDVTIYELNCVSYF